MFRKATVALALIGLLMVYACDTPEAPQSSTSSWSSSSLPKEKVPPTSKDDSTKNATTAMEAWLKLLDTGQYPVCWDQTGSGFKQAVPKDSWVKLISGLRAAFGPLISRKTKSVEYKTSVRGAPPGVYVDITYDSTFANMKAALEQVSATYEGGKWLSMGYSIAAAPSPKPDSATATPAPKP